MWEAVIALVSMMLADDKVSGQAVGKRSVLNAKEVANGSQESTA